MNTMILLKIRMANFNLAFKAGHLLGFYCFEAGPAFLTQTVLIFSSWQHISVRVTWNVKSIRCATITHLIF